MRDAFGGAFMLKIALVFLVVYVCFMAGAVTYAKAFRVKNQVINILEQFQFNGDISTISGEVDGYLATVPYSYDAKEASMCPGGSYTDRGVCIIDMGAVGGGSSNQKYYKVITFINLSIFNLNVTIPISGETKSIYTT